jgi:hypothetical protein
MAKKKKAAKKKRAQSGPKGDAFERRIAQKLREVYDPPELLAEIAKATKEKRVKDRTVLLKRSRVRRSEQSKGAREPDVVVKGCPCWIECQDAATNHFTPLEKYAQAERDVDETDQWASLWPVAVCHKTGEHKIGVWIAFHHLVLLANIQPLLNVDGEPGPLNLFSKGFELEQPVRIDIEDFLTLLRDDYARTEEEEAKRIALLQRNAAGGR